MSTVVKEKKDTRGKVISLAWHAVARLLIRLHRLVLLVGPSGVGKSYFASLVGRELTGEEPDRVCAGPQADRATVWGYWTIRGGEHIFSDGPLPRSLKRAADGRKAGVLVVEEIQNMPMDLRSELLAVRGATTIDNPLNGERLAIGDRWKLLATGNPEDMACRRNSGIAQALYDDFMILTIDPLSRAEIREMLLANHPALREQTELLDRILRLWEDYQTVGEQKGEDRGSFLTYRAADHLAKLCLCDNHVPFERKVEVALVNKYITADKSLWDSAKLKLQLLD